MGLVMEGARLAAILETSAEAFRIADAAKAAGHEVRVVPATMVRLLGVGERQAHGQGAAERLANDNRLSCRRDPPDDAVEIAHERIHIGRRIAQRIRGDAVGTRQQRQLAIEQPAGAVEGAQRPDRTGIALAVEQMGQDRNGRRLAVGG